MNIRALALLSTAILAFGGISSAAGGSASTTRRATNSTTPLARYLSAVSVPVRESVVRVGYITTATDSWLVGGDPPFLGGIIRGCSKIGALEPAVRLRHVGAPTRLRSSHLALSHASSNLTAECAKARRSARATITAMNRFSTTRRAADELAARRARAATRTELQQFTLTLRSFTQTVTTWRAAVLRYAAAIGQSPPAWVRALQ
jgi:hypothetical protein